MLRKLLFGLIALSIFSVCVGYWYHHVLTPKLNIRPKLNLTPMWSIAYRGRQDDFIVLRSSIDDIVFEEETRNSTKIVEHVPRVVQQKINDIMDKEIESSGLFLHELTWKTDRLEIILSGNGDADEPDSPNVDDLMRFHRSMYEKMELDEELNRVLVNFEVLVASPGVSNILKIDRDYESFKGFPVIATTTTEFKKKTKFEGTLVERTEAAVVLSLKGRVVKIPRDLIDQVRLPDPKYEDTDNEIHKL